jgi:hypothetical protein
LPERLAKRVIVDDPIDLLAEHLQQLELEICEIRRSVFDRYGERLEVYANVSVHALLADRFFL